ncbi:MAG TPA: hypothetical protein VF985_05460, partial [Mariniflexile sp.]
GDHFVDVLGIDIYDFQNAVEYSNSVVNDLKIIKNIASKKNKLYALTETGIHKFDDINWFTEASYPDRNWFNEVLYPNLENSGISWVLFWRNGGGGEQYMPNKTHKSEADFKAFAKQPQALFLKDINNIKY